MKIKTTLYGFDIIVEEEDGHFIASLPALQKCKAISHTAKGAIDKIKDALEIYFTFTEIIIPKTGTWPQTQREMKV